MNWKWILLLMIIVFIIVRTCSRRYFWKVRKTGEKLSFRGFLKRWAKGIEGITALQQAKAQVMGTWITLVGITAGIIVTAIVRIQNMWWWIEVILVGSLIVTGTAQIGAIQKFKRLKAVEMEMLESMKN